MVPLNPSNKQLFEVSIINIPRFKKNKIRSISCKYEKKEIHKNIYQTKDVKWKVIIQFPLLTS